MATQALALVIKRPVLHLVQLSPLAQVEQVLLQLLHFPSAKYLPAMHPGLQVDSVKSHPSLQAEHWEISDPVHWEQATSQALQTPCLASPKNPAGQVFTQADLDRKDPDGQVVQTSADEQLPQEEEQALQTAESA